jgi:hypothetical protein
MFRRKLFLACCAAFAAAAMTAPAQGSSHREAPFITEQPKVDGTDFYMFRSYESGRAGFVTLIANYQPGQNPYDGPNYYMFDPEALYEIHIDNNGDGVEDITFQFQFTNTNKDTKLSVGGKQMSIPLIQSGPITSVNPATLNVRETYTLQVVRGGRRSSAGTDVTNAATGAAVFDKPVDRIGNKTLPDYPAYAAQHIYNVNIPGCGTPGRVFVGQRKDPFYIAVGEIFDLVNIADPVGSPNADADDLGDKNVSTLALEVPITCLTAGADPVIGGWTTASVRQGRLINPFLSGGSTTTATREGGAWAQVSRLGMPLVNEVVIGLKDKDRFNASKPSGDAQFLDYVTHPTLPALIETLFPTVTAPTKFPRNDLVAAFLTGIPGVNKPASGAPSEMLRLNTSIAAIAAGSQNALGVLGGDNAGFPNGRRPGDDVVDIELRVAMGALCHLPGSAAAFGCVAADAPSGTAPFTDQVRRGAGDFDTTFPYLRTPLTGSPTDY